MARLEYDDSAFIYFAIGLLTCLLLPFSVSFIIATVRGLRGGDENVGDIGESGKGRTKLEKEKFDRMMKEKGGVKGVFHKSHLTRFGILAFGWFMVYLLYSQSGDQAVIQQFDPWEVLGVEEGAKERKIKKAYRNLCLEYHPDRVIKKSVDERAYAAMMLEKVQKAHEILTDEESFKRFMDTGSPDGSKQMEVSIGLPKFLLEKRNHNLVLVVYLIVLVVITPIGVAVWYSGSKLYGDKLILNDSYNIYSFLLSEFLPMKHLPEVLALSAEFRKLPLRGKADEENLEALRKEMIDDGVMPKATCAKVATHKMMQRWRTCDRANVLIHVYLNRLSSKLTPGLQQDLEFILSKSNILITAMIDTVKYSRNVKWIENIIHFEQYLTQGIYFNQSELLQLPYFGKDEISNASSGKGGVTFISQYIKTNSKEGDGRRKGMAKMTAEQVADVNEVIKLLPDIEVRVTIGVVAHEHSDGTVEFEEEACEGDIMTAYIELFRNHQVGPVHAPFLPSSKEEEWTVLFLIPHNDKALATVNLKGDNQVVRERIQFPSKGFLKPGNEHTFNFEVLSNAYIGFDKKIPAKIKILPEGAIKPPQPHPEDLLIDNEPSPFEEAFGKTEYSDDSDFADSDDETTAAQNDDDDDQDQDNLVADDEDDDSSNKKKK